jgi:Glycosyl transferase family 90
MYLRTYKITALGAPYKSTRLFLQLFLLSIILLSIVPSAVPLTATAADLVEKVVWLKQNQDMAKTLAANARNFAASYLRLEDYHCYIATLLEKLPEVSAALV